MIAVIRCNTSLNPWIFQSKELPQANCINCTTAAFSYLVQYDKEAKPFKFWMCVSQSAWVCMMHRDVLRICVCGSTQVSTLRL